MVATMSIWYIAIPVDTQMGEEKSVYNYLRLDSHKYNGLAHVNVLYSVILHLDGDISFIVFFSLEMSSHLHITHLFKKCFPIFLITDRWLC